MALLSQPLHEWPSGAAWAQTGRQGRGCWGSATNLEFQLHCSNALAWWHLGQLLDVSKEVACRHLGIATCGCLQQGLVDEDVLVLCLHHVVALRAHARHVAVDVHSLLMLHPLQHSINDNEATSSAHASTAETKHVA